MILPFNGKQHLSVVVRHDADRDLVAHRKPVAVDRQADRSTDTQRELIRQWGASTHTAAVESARGPSGAAAVAFARLMAQPLQTDRAEYVGDRDLG